VAVQYLEDRIKANIKIDSNGCWNWQLSKERGGYGKIKVAYKSKLAHRVSYEVFVGEIPNGLQLDHICKVRACVNPAHLEPVTAKENLHRSSLKELWAAKKEVTHCPQGHKYTTANTLIKQNKWGNDCRNCRTCHRERELTRYHAKKLEMAVA
jgi:hypothetical protein